MVGKGVACDLTNYLHRSQFQVGNTSQSVGSALTEEKEEYESKLDLGLVNGGACTLPYKAHLGLSSDKTFHHFLYLQLNLHYSGLAYDIF